MNMAAHSAQLAVRPPVSDDLELVHASKNGDVAAFEQLVKRHDRRLHRIAQHVLHNTEDSEDAVQEAFLKAFQHLADFREDSQFSTWLIRITVNQSLMKLRKLRSIREVSAHEDFHVDGNILPMEVADWAPNPEERYGTSELRDILIKALEVLNVSQAAVKARCRRARLQLREHLNKYFNNQVKHARAELVSSGGQTGSSALFAKCLDHDYLRYARLVLPSHHLHPLQQ